MKAKLQNLVATALILLSINAKADDIIKTGINIGPLPAVSYDEDRGFQYGGLVQFYDYGDGSTYPMYKSRTKVEVSAYTKGTFLTELLYDKVELFPGVRLNVDIKYTKDKANDFLGFNGYNSNVQLDGVSGLGYDGYFKPFYKLDKQLLMANAYLTFKITEKLKWELGYHFSYYNIGRIDVDKINEGKSEARQFTYAKTLYDYYTDWGIIPESEKNGGIASRVRLGIQYDSRDKEGSPASGIWAEAHLNLSPKWLGSTTSSYRYAATFRQYFPVVENDILTFAYRLHYEGTIGNYAPYYLLSYMTTVGIEADQEGMGGMKTCRGIIRNRVVGLDNAAYNAELRWRFLKTRLWNQNIALGLSLFSDGAMAVRTLDTSYNPVNAEGLATKNIYDMFVTGKKDTPHITVGLGFRFIMNENFIVSVDYGQPISKYYSASNPLKGQDGNGGLYVGLNHLF